MATTHIELTVDEDIMNEALKVFEQFGVDASNAVNMFFKNVVQTKSIPFEISLNDTNRTIYNMSDNEFVNRAQMAIDNRDNS